MLEIGEAGDGREVGHRIIAGILEQDAVGGVRLVGAEHDDVAIGLRSCHLAGAERARGSRLVVDHHGPAARGLQFLGDDAGKGIRRPSGRIGHHHADRLRWKSLGAGGERHRGGGRSGQHRAASQSNSDDSHGVSSPRALSPGLEPGLRRHMRRTLIVPHCRQRRQPPVGA